MESRSAPDSKEVNRPETSTSETRPDWRILMEKSAMVTVQALSGGRKQFYQWNRRGTSNIPKKQKIVKKNVGPVTASAERPFAICASLSGVRGASFPRGPRERFPDRARDISGARRWWGEIATRARPYKRAEGLAAAQRRENSRNEQFLRSATRAECATTSRRPPRAGECARWLLVR